METKDLQRCKQWRARKYQVTLEELYQSTGEVMIQQLFKQLSAALPTQKKYRLLVYYTLKTLKNLILGQTKSTSLNYRRVHSKFLRNFRKALNQLEHKKVIDDPIALVCKEALNNLSSVRFLGIHCFTFGTDLIEQVILNGLSQRNQSDTLDNLDQWLENAPFDEECFCISNADKHLKAPFLFMAVRKLFGRTNTFFDPHQYNHPFLLYTFDLLQADGGVKEVSIIRMGTPTKEFFFGCKAKIIPEFKSYLRFLQEKGQVHLYINKQQLKGVEGYRSKALKDLQLEFNNFYCVSLPSDGVFYEQGTEALSGEEFKEIFFQVLISDTGDFDFPGQWKEDKAFILELKRLLDEVHEDFFGNKSELKSPDLRNFIEHYYTLLELFLIYYTAADSFNITCKDGIDRAAKEQTKLLLYLQVIQEVNEDIETKKERWYAMHVPSFFVKKRSIISSRRTRLSGALKGYTETTKQRLRKRHQQKMLVKGCPRFVKREKQPISF